MEQTNEPSVKQGTCSYCADAQVSHVASYIEGLVSITFDAHMMKVVSMAPRFIKDLSDLIPIFLFKTLLFFKLAELSSDIDRAKSFRSKIIWQEAERRGIKMKQLFLFGKPLDHYRANINGKNVYFESIPTPVSFLDIKKNWDDKIVLKKEFSKHSIPVPFYFKLPFFHIKSLEDIFSQFKKPVIVKPQVGSRARHTVTNIHTLKQFKKGIEIVKQICPFVVVEEHLDGYICRATLVNGVLAGFYRGHAPFVLGDGKKTIRELIEEKDTTREARVEQVRIGQELTDHIARSGFAIDDILPAGKHLSLSHRTGRLFGGATREMIDELHPSFIPILEKAGKITGLAVAGFDCIIPDPTKDESSQRWGIIECNTLPFIDLHYYALSGTPRNIAGMIWDLWK